jgi:hypothetical protein
VTLGHVFLHALGAGLLAQTRRSARSHNTNMPSDTSNQRGPGYAYNIGRSVARLPLWVKALVLFSVGASIFRLMATQAEGSRDPAPSGIAAAALTTSAGLAAAKARTTAAVEAQRHAAEAKRLECETKLPAQKSEYEALLNQGKFWDAAERIRSCTETLKRPELESLVRAAEIKSHMADINNPKLPPRNKATAMELLIRDYPEVGRKYEGQPAKLIALAERQDAASLVAAQRAEAAKKRSQGVRIGMLKVEVLASSWGRPKSINTTTTAFGEREQWVYGGNNYLYFNNGVLESIQN